MDTREVRKKKLELENEIGHLIATYETETQTRIEDIEIERLSMTEYGEVPVDFLTKIKIKAVIR